MVRLLPDLTAAEVQGHTDVPEETVSAPPQAWGCQSGSDKAANGSVEHVRRYPWALIPNQRTPLDIVAHTFGASHKFRILAATDDCCRKNLCLVTDASIPRARVAREFDALVRINCKPACVVSYIGTEFTSKAILKWSKRRKLGRCPIFQSFTGAALKCCVRSIRSLAGSVSRTLLRGSQSQMRPLACAPRPFAMPHHEKNFS